VKIRFGVGMGADTAPDQLAGIVDHLEASGVDSLWFSELVYSPAVDPVVGMAYALARTTRLKVGTSVAVLPGRHPVLVAKQLASLAGVAPKRVLPVFGLRSAIPAEREVFVVPDGERAAVFDESLRVLRSALVDGSASYSGRFFTVSAAEIEPDHFGISLAVADGELPAELAAAARRRRPDLDPGELIAVGWDRLHRQLDAYLEAGLTKFVIRPAGRAPLDGFIDRFVAELVGRQN
jgi:alkanesulfonate monooxygenase SsuD/methylene tetrahydromethanopterin reductase-like flavin-dependent oxidoreductase (luciferase family)